jgi:hypothetical protein
MLKVLTARRLLQRKLQRRKPQPRKLPLQKLKLNQKLTVTTLVLFRLRKSLPKLSQAPTFLK